MGGVHQRSGGIQPAPEMTERGLRFIRRRNAWRREPQRHYGRHAQIEPHAPKILAFMFDRALVVRGPCRVYAFKVDGLETVFMNGESWLWHTALGTAEGRGLYELWSWRFDVPVHVAASQVFALLNERADHGS